MNKIKAHEHGLDVLRTEYIEETHEVHNFGLRLVQLYTLSTKAVAGVSIFEWLKCCGPVNC